MLAESLECKSAVSPKLQCRRLFFQDIALEELSVMNNRMLVLGISAVCAALVVGIGSLVYRTGAQPSRSAAVAEASTVGVGSSSPRLAGAAARSNKAAQRRASKRVRQVKYTQDSNAVAPSLADRRINPRLP
jgi:hypothetical protein